MRVDDIQIETYTKINILQSIQLFFSCDKKTSLCSALVSKYYFKEKPIKNVIFFYIVNEYNINTQEKII